MEHYPAILNATETGKLLHYIAMLIETGDSFEGFIEYLIPDNEEDIDSNKFAVRARFRVGNSQGQGGLTVIGELK